MGKRANYRKKDGSRLSAVEYRKRRKREIYFHISLVILIPILMITGVFVALNKIKNGKVPVQEVEIADNSTQELTIIDTVVEDVEIEEKNPYLARSADSDSFFEGYDASLDSDTVGITSEEVQSV